MYPSPPPPLRLLLSKEPKLRHHLIPQLKLLKISLFRIKWKFLSSMFNDFKNLVLNCYSFEPQMPAAPPYLQSKPPLSCTPLHLPSHRVFASLFPCTRVATTHARDSGLAPPQLGMPPQLHPLHLDAFPCASFIGFVFVSTPNSPVDAVFLKVRARS